MADANWYPKREARRFEPPPWEREQFEALKKQREEAVASEERPVPVRPVAEEAPGEAIGAADTAAPGQEREPQPAAVLPEAQVEAMLVQLQAEEPRLDRSVKMVGLFSAGIVIFLGVSIFGWGAIASLRAKGNAMAMAASTFLLVLGFGLAGLGYWLGLRATKRGD